MFSLLLASAALIQQPKISDLYEKFEYSIPARDGVTLHTVVYVPKKEGKHPILMERTPYSAGPYGEGKFPNWGFGGSRKFVDASYIFAFQDVRGRGKSTGEFEEIRPILSAPKGKEIDESTDAYDTIDYLVKNVPRNNGRVGMWGISYPGFYASAGGVRTHPALKAISPQAPVSEWWYGDDVHHNGAFFLLDNFSFYFFFGYGPGDKNGDHAQVEPPARGTDAYTWYLKEGNSQDLERKYYKGHFPFWNEIIENDSYNAYWQARSAPPKLKDIKCAVLTVGGWFDAEDLYGTFDTYKHIEKQNPNAKNWLIVGPWNHGGWSNGRWERWGRMNFGSDTSKFYQDKVEFPFFDAYLRGDGEYKRPEATMFATGSNKWHNFETWPPTTMKERDFYLADNQKLKDGEDAGAEGDSYEVDPENPIPFQPGRIMNRRDTYMIEDQKFLNDRKDILRYESEPFGADVTFAGPVGADLYIKSTGTDADLIVKVIDLEPDGTQGLVRWEVMRSKFRDDASKPRPLKPGQVERVRWNLPDMLHTFKAGHKLQIQVQSSWFPLIDRNPNQFLNIHKAKPEDFKKATITVLHTGNAPSKITFGQLAD